LKSGSILFGEQRRLSARHPKNCRAAFLLFIAIAAAAISTGKIQIATGSPTKI